MNHQKIANLAIALALEAGDFAGWNEVCNALLLLKVCYGCGYSKPATCPRLARWSTPPKSHWKWTWIFNVALNLIANLIIAGIIKSSVGYKADFKLWELTLFLLARPRLAWIVLAFMADKWGETVSVKVNDQALLMYQTAAMGLGGQNTAYKSVVTTDTQLHSMPSTTTLNSTLWASEIYDDPHHGPTEMAVQRRWDLPYHDTFLSAFIAETILQLAALYVMGLTVKFAWQRGYYNVGFKRALYK